MNSYLAERIRQFKEAGPNAGQPIYLRLRKMLEEMILGGELPDGYRLPSDREFSELLGVNHITLGKAFNELRRRGLLERGRLRGTFVKAPAGTPDTVPGEKSKLVAVIFDNVSRQTFQSELFVALHDHLLEIGKEILFLSSSGREDIQLEQIQGILQRPNCCGCLVWSILDGSRVRQLMQMKPVDFPLIFMDKRYPDAGHDVVIYDSLNAGMEIGRHFIRQGYEKFIFLSHVDRMKYSSIQDRLQGLRQSAAERNLPPKAIQTISYRDIAEIDPAKLMEKCRGGVLVTAYNTEAQEIATQFQSAGMEYLKLHPFVTFGPIIHGAPVPGVFEYNFNIDEFARKAVELLQERLNGVNGPWKVCTAKGELKRNPSTKYSIAESIPK